MNNQKLNSLKLNNTYSYLKYNLKHKPLFLICSIIILLILTFIFIQNVISPVLFIIVISLFLIVNIYYYIFREKKRSFKNSSEILDKSFYDKIHPPTNNNDWLKINFNNNGTEEPIFTNDIINQALRSNVEFDLIKTDNNLNKRIKDNYNAIYHPILRSRYNFSNSNGKLFFNDTKVGLAKELDVKNRKAYLFKTSYYDNFVTNSSLGKIYTIEDMDYPMNTDDYKKQLYDLKGDKSHLKLLDETILANQVGITTLCFTKDNEILLWRQNSINQGSNNFIAGSGSGSLDWRDCDSTVSFNSIIEKAMIRELYEESGELFDLDFEDFYSKTETKLIGYFRWLKKGASPEFSGISRLSFDISKNPKNNSSGFLEVDITNNLPADNIYKLKKEIESLLNSSDNYQMSNISVSGAASLYFLNEISNNYCKTCKYRNNCQKENCSAIPYKVFFEEKSYN